MPNPKFPNMPDETPIENKTTDQIASELDALILEEKQLDLEIKRETVAKNRALRASKLEEARTKILATRQFLAQREAQQKNCSHRKGGQGAEAVMRGQGNSAYYSVIKHRLPNGRYFCLCQRCGKEWHPADPYNVEGGRIAPKAATPGWETAIEFATDNSSSSSSTFLFQKEEVVQ